MPVRLGELAFRVDGYAGDTNILAKNINPDVVKGSKSSTRKDQAAGIPLSWVAQTYTDTETWKPPKKVKGRPKFEKLDDLFVYNAMDCRVTVQAYPELWEDFQRQKLSLAQLELDMAHQYLAIDMQRIGLPVDTGRLAALERQTKADMEEAQEKFRAIAGRDVNINKPAEVAQVLFQEWGLPVVAMGKPDARGHQQASTADPVLIDLEVIAAGPGYRERPLIADGIACLRAARRHAQVLKLYIGGWGRMIRNGWIHPSWRACMTVTGRYTSSPNFQNLSGGIKSVICAPPGWVFVGADYAALEQRIMAAIAGGDLFAFVNKPDDDARKFDPDYDCHSHVSRLVYGEAFTNPAIYLDPAKFPTPAAMDKEVKRKRKSIRNATKRIVYARNYGSGLNTIWGIVKEDDARADKSEVGRTIDAYDQRFPELPAYRERMHRQVNDPRVRALFSCILRRRRHFPGTGVVPVTDAANFPIQSTAADIVNIRMYELAKRLPRNAYIIAQVHDSVTVLCPKQDGEAVRQLMDEVLPCYYDFGKGAMLFDAKAAVGESWDQV